MGKLKKILLSVGWFGVFLVYTSANRSPANGYELAVYQATPLLFWVGLGVALLTTLCTVLYYRGKTQKMGIIIGILAIFAFASLPYLRSYFYYGAFDTVNHLGTVVDFLGGYMGIDVVMYPGLHLYASAISLLLGFEPRLSLLLIVGICIGIFVLSVPLVTRFLTQDPEIQATSWVTALLLMPIMGVRIPRFEATPTLIALMFVPICFLSVLLYFNNRRYANRIVVLFTFSALVLFHPQQAVVFISGLFLFTSYIFFRDHIHTSSIRPNQLASITLLSSVILALWLSNQRGFTSAAAGYLESLFTSPSASGATPQSSSVEAVGLTLFQIYTRTLLVETAAAIVVGVVVVAFLVPQIRPTVPVDNRTFTLTVSMFIPAGFFFVIFLAIGSQSQFLRYVSYLLVFGTIVLPIGLHWSIGGVFPSQISVILITIVLVFGLFATIPALHPSPFVFQSNQQLTEGQMSGYEKTFEHQMDGTSITALHTSVFRHRNALYGKAASERGLHGMTPVMEAIKPLNNHRSYWRNSYVHPHFNDQDLPNGVERNTYVVVTDSDYQERVGLYGGLTFTKDDFQYLDRDPRINKPISNGDAEIYYVHSSY
ncbi:hypothetical protein OB955_19420 [Halobacteria archaeon AArc-m2/3/4]|uniref:Uncharacterized protein n=1 Tax=Natronoglomus mannanivorans TaxID=2979990 RepID=A0ABT2QIY7_9EURY|nr:hypothetical protein [Halobacteria archaeon AArc-m2/3/4]